MEKFQAFKKDEISDMSHIHGGAYKETTFQQVVMDCDGYYTSMASDTIKYKNDGSIKWVKATYVKGHLPTTPA